MTRAAFALASGHLHDAIHLHPLVLPLVPLTALVALEGCYHYVRYGVWRSVAFEQRWWVTVSSAILGFLMLVVWFARFFGAFGGPVPV